MIEHPPPRLPSRAAIAWIVGLASLMTLLNAFKPIHMDDAVYHMYASQIAAHPDDPYGGEVLDYWFPPKSGMDVLAPVMVPYLWSRSLVVHGEATFLDKLWLAPFPLLLVGAAWGLGHRFARGYEPVLACLVATSPAILPSQNFMLDVPALALGLAGLVVFMRACDGGSYGIAIGAGLLSGVAINTKWTGLLAPAVIGLYAWRRRRIDLGAVAMMTSLAVFAGWELWIACEYGQSHFLLHSARKSTPLMDRINGIRGLVSILGGVAPGVLVMGLVALRRPRAAAVAAGVTVVGIGGIALGLGPQAVFLTIGGLLAVNLGTVAFGLLRRRTGGQASSRRRLDGDDLFVVLWLGLEIIGFFVLSPYSAVRRVLGIVVAASVLVVRLASRTGRTAPALRKTAGWAAGGCAALGLFYFAIDFEEAAVESYAAKDAAARVQGRIRGGETSWFAGRWGFRYHAEKAGLTPIAPGRTELKPGDLLLVHDNKVIEEPRITIDPAQAEEIETIAYDAPGFLPKLRTVPTFYAGKNPLERQVGSRFVVHIYRIKRPFTPLGLVPPWYGPKDREVGALMQAGRSRK